MNALSANKEQVWLGKLLFPIKMSMRRNTKGTQEILLFKRKILLLLDGVLVSAVL